MSSKLDNFVMEYMVNHWYCRCFSNQHLHQSLSSSFKHIATQTMTFDGVLRTETFQNVRCNVSPNVSECIQCVSMCDVTVMHSGSGCQCVQMSPNANNDYQCCPNVTSMYQYLLRHWNRFNIFIHCLLNMKLSHI